MTGPTYSPITDEMSGQQLVYQGRVVMRNALAMVYICKGPHKGYHRVYYDKRRQKYYWQDKER